MSADTIPDTRSTTGIGRAVDAAGGFSALALQIGTRHQVVHRWWKRGFLPPERAMQVHQLYPAILTSELMDPYLVALASPGE